VELEPSMESLDHSSCSLLFSPIVVSSQNLENKGL
jgi:hypothetical protein